MESIHDKSCLREYCSFYQDCNDALPYSKWGCSYFLLNWNALTDNQKKYNR